MRRRSHGRFSKGSPPTSASCPTWPAVTAASPTLLAAFDALRRTVGDPTFDPVHREIAGVAVGVAVDNAYGVAFHSTVLGKPRRRRVRHRLDAGRLRTERPRPCRGLRLRPRRHRASRQGRRRRRRHVPTTPDSTPAISSSSSPSACSPASSASSTTSPAGSRWTSSSFPGSGSRAEIARRISDVTHRWVFS